MNKYVFDFLVNFLAGGRFVPKRLRKRLYSRGGIISKSVTFGDHCYFSGPNVKVGENTYINRNVYFDCQNNITIGNNVFIAMNVQFITSTHIIGGKQQRAGNNCSEPITVEDGCWIGCGAILLPGSIVRQGVVVAGGSVVHGTLDPNCLYGGNPIRCIKRLEI